MGFRYRRSVSLGGGFRVNFSKSGVGYSFGGKGFRYTRTARGTERVTISIPGTGISWVQESKLPRQSSKKSEQPKGLNEPRQKSISTDEQYLYSIESEDTEKLTSQTKEAFISEVKKYISTNRALTWVAVLFFVLAVFIEFPRTISIETASNIRLSMMLLPVVIKLIHYKTGRVPVVYEYDDVGIREKIKVQRAMECISGCASIWQINDVYTHDNRRIHAGTAQSVARKQVKIEKKKPYFLLSNEDAYCVKLKKEKMYILPDMAIFVSGRKIGAVALSSMKLNFGTMQFVEEGSTPSDAAIVRQTWKYVNNNGTPDRRYNGNRRLPVCLYAVVNIFTDTGVNLQFYLSNLKKAEELQTLINSEMYPVSANEEKTDVPEEPVVDENVKCIIDGLRLWPIQVESFHRAKTVKEFFEKYDGLCTYSEQLIQSEENYIKNSGSEAFKEETRETLKNVRNSDTLEDELLDFIERSFKVCLDKILYLKTKKARKNNAVRWYSEFEPYKERLSSKATEDIESKYERLLLECEKGN